METPMTQANTPPQPPQPPTPPAPQNPPVMENGGATSGTWKEWAKKTNWVEVGFMTLGAAAFLFLIRYYRQRMYMEKEAIKKLQLKQDEIASEMAGLKSTMKKSAGRSDGRGGF